MMQDHVQNNGVAREALCRLLAACYYQPGPEYGEEDVFGAIARAAALVHPEMEQSARRLKQAFEAESQDQLLLDYSRLFLGPFEIQAKPYGSVWLEGEKVAMGESTMAVRQLYREGGFELAESFLDLPDHIAVELEFLYLLIFKENEGEAGDAPTLREVKELKRRFLRTHLGKWIGPFTAAVRQSARTDFYSALADLTAAFVLAEQELAERS